MSDTSEPTQDPRNQRGQDRSAAARQRARDRGANAHGPGGNPNPDNTEDEAVDDSATE